MPPFWFWPLCSHWAPVMGVPGSPTCDPAGPCGCSLLVLMPTVPPSLPEGPQIQAEGKFGIIGGGEPSLG